MAVYKKIDEVEVKKHEYIKEQYKNVLSLDLSDVITKQDLNKKIKENIKDIIFVNDQQKETYKSVYIINIIYSIIVPAYKKYKNDLDIKSLEPLAMPFKIKKIKEKLNLKLDLPLLYDIVNVNEMNPIDNLNKFEQINDNEDKAFRSNGPVKEKLATLSNSDGNIVYVYKYYVPYLSNANCGTLEIAKSDMDQVGAVIHNPVSPGSDAFDYGDSLWAQIMAGLNPNMTQSATDEGNGVLYMPLDRGAPHAGNYCVNNSRYGIEMFGESSHETMRYVEKNTAVFIKWASEHYGYANCADGAHREYSSTACPKVSVDVHGSAGAVIDYINNNIPGGYTVLTKDYCDSHPGGGTGGGGGSTSGYYLTGNRYLISGGNYLGSTYLAYDSPGGSQNMQFVCDSGQYWADEISNNWFLVCDDEYRFFYIPRSDCSSAEYAGEHKY